MVDNENVQLRKRRNGLRTKNKKFEKQKKHFKKSDTKRKTEKKDTLRCGQINSVENKKMQMKNS